MLSVGADKAAETLQNEILAAAKEFVPPTILKETESTHPWINERVMELVRQKHTAGNTTQAGAALEASSRGLKEEFEKHVGREKEALQKAPKATKGWRAKSGRLLRQRARTSAIPALRNGSGEWILEAKGKRDLLALNLVFRASAC